MGSEGNAGVVFHLEDSKLAKAAKGYSGRVQLTAQVIDYDLWQDLVARFKEGLPLYRGKDIKEQVIEILQEDRAALQTESERQIHALRSELERARQEISKLRAQLNLAARPLPPAVAEQTRELEQVAKSLVSGILEDTKKE